jgi:D-alanyl-D-alanine carboxypeptidase
MTFQNPSWAWAAGGMISNLDDLKIWAEALGTGKLLTKEAFQERTKWVNASPNGGDRKYGLGVGLDQGWLMHAGELPGYNSIVAYLPEQKVVLVCLVNSNIPAKEKDHEISPAPYLFESVSKILFPENIPSVPKS